MTEQKTQVSEQFAKYVAALVNGKHEITSVTIRPKREWVGLTEEERFQIAEQTGCMSADWLDVIRATETALQIKNK